MSYPAPVAGEHLPTGRGAHVPRGPMTITLDERSIRECLALVLSSVFARPIVPEEIKIDHIGCVHDDIVAVLELEMPPLVLPTPPARSA